MNNEELKKKIVEVVNQWHMFQNRDMHGHTIWMTNDTEKIADALIAAGIGDMKEVEHRAEVAERKAKYIDNAFHSQMMKIALDYEYAKKFIKFTFGTIMQIYEKAIDKAVEQAEKELKGEEK